MLEFVKMHNQSSHHLFVPLLDRVIRVLAGEEARRLLRPMPTYILK